MLLHLSLSTLLVEKWQKQCAYRSTWFGKRKKVIENRDESKITKYLIFPICFCKRETFYIFFTYFINSKLISELVISDKTVFLCISASQV